LWQNAQSVGFIYKVEKHLVLSLSFRPLDCHETLTAIFVLNSVKIGTWKIIIFKVNKLLPVILKLLDRVG
jgi:hypothetical protein